MNGRPPGRGAAWAWWVAACLAPAAVALAAPLGSAFTYQGQLKESGQPASSLYDLQVCLFDDLANSVPLACIANIDDVPVEEGLFSVVLDFGATPFAGELRYLELRVRPGASSGAYTTLTPRQAIRPAPEALRAATSSAAPWSGLSGVPAGFADGIDNTGTGTVTSVASGTGLTGGPITGSGTLAIATAGVGTAQLANDAVDASKLAANAVDTAALVDANVTTGKIADDAISAAKLANNAVDTAAIVDANVTRVKIAPGAVGLAQIDTLQVQERISGVCPQGTYLVAIGSGGSLLCQEQPGIGVTTTVDDPANNVGFDISIAIGADRMPVIAYFDDSADALKVAKCANPACTGAATITTVDDPPNSVGSHTSIAIGLDGLPVISYQDFTAGTLKVAKCTNTSCTGASTITVVDDPAAFVGSYTALAVAADGRPVIAYQDVTNSALKVAKCANPACTGAATITTVEDATEVLGAHVALAIAPDGLPVISYFDDTADALRVAKCASADCTGTATITVVDDPANAVGYDTSIAIGSGGRPVISYLDATAAALKVALCANANCTGVATITTVDDSASNLLGSNTSIAISGDGFPVISYQDFTAGVLKVAKCFNAACTASTLISTVDDPPNFVATSTALAIGADGLPVIAYQDFSANALKVVKCGSRSCR